MTASIASITTKDDLPCVEHSTLFLSEDPLDQGHAATYCTECPVVRQCRELGKRESFGVWGGIVIKERRSS